MQQDGRSGQVADQVKVWGVEAAGAGDREFL
jgi:hypothetical protein